MIDRKDLPYFRDIPYGARFRYASFPKTLWVKTERITPPGANHWLYNAAEVGGNRQMKFGWRAKVMVEYLPTPPVLLTDEDREWGLRRAKALGMTEE